MSFSCAKAVISGLKTDIHRLRSGIAGKPDVRFAGGDFRS
jgi:hypothetical protein